MMAASVGCSLLVEQEGCLGLCRLVASGLPPEHKRVQGDGAQTKEKLNRT